MICWRAITFFRTDFVVEKLTSWLLAVLHGDRARLRRAAQALFDLLEIAWLPALVEKRLGRAVEATVKKPVRGSI